MLQVDLFEKITNTEVLELLKCIGIKTKAFKKNSTVIKTGSKIDFLCVILEGTLVVNKTDISIKLAEETEAQTMSSPLSAKPE